jgi:phosphoglycolate phosphatase
MSTIYFDLDGTLTDPKTGITRCIRYALNELGRHAPPEDELTWCIGPPLRASLKQLVGTDELADLALSLYRKRFSEIGLYENSVYPQIEGVLATLRQSGHRLFVATSKPGVYAERIIGHFNLTGYFERVFGSELDGVRSEDPARAIMIGDRRHDMIGARNNRMTAIGVLYGYGNAQELMEAGAHHVCATPQAVLEWIR